MGVNRHAFLIDVIVIRWRSGNFKSIRNKYFPWELQIWDAQDAPGNYHEHFRHEAEKGE